MRQEQGNCHIFVDESADVEKAIPIILNAKTQRIGVRNAGESLVIHEKIKDRLLPELAKALYEKNVEIRGDELFVSVFPVCRQRKQIMEPNIWISSFP